METLGKRFTASRLAAGLSRRGVARAMIDAGYKTTSGTMIGNYEQDINVPSAVYVLAYCEALDINPTWLISGTGRRQWGKDDEARHGRLQAAAWMEDFAAWLRRDVQRNNPTPVEALDPMDLIDPESVHDQRDPFRV